LNFVNGSLLLARRVRSRLHSADLILGALCAPIEDWEAGMRFSTGSIGPRGTSALILLIALSASLVRPPLVFAATYTLVDLGTLGGRGSWATAINGAGQVVGASHAPGGQQHAFLYTSGRMIDLGTLGGSRSDATGIDASGRVVGTSRTPEDAEWRAFLYGGTQMRDLGTLGGSDSFANAISSTGAVVGLAQTAASGQRAFFFDGSSMQDLGTLGGGYSRAAGVNAAGQVIGESSTHDGKQRAFRYGPGGMIDLGTLGGSYSSAYGINSLGHVVGVSLLAGETPASHAFLCDDTGMYDLGTLGGNWSLAKAINASGQVVGSSYAPDGSIRAFIYSGYRAGRMEDLNAHIPHGTGWLLAGANAINDAGQVVGYGYLGGQMRAFLLTPSTLVPPAMPCNLILQVVSSTQIQLSWMDHSDNETAFAIWRKSGEGGFVRVGVAAPNTSTFLDQELTPGTVYTYRVRATNNYAASEWTNEASGTTLPAN
jgi:probable HAF family extracellular repeat protein